MAKQDAKAMLKTTVQKLRKCKKELLWAAQTLVRHDIITRSRGAEMCGMGWQAFEATLKETNGNQST